MGLRTLDLIVLSAKNLKNVNFISKMDVYVDVSLDGDPHNSQKSRSPVDRDGGNNPAWNFFVRLYIDESSAQQNCLSLRFNIRCDHDKDIGVVIVPVKELLDSSSSETSQQSTVTYQVRKPSGKFKGELRFSYKFSDEPTADVASAHHSAAPMADAAVTADPVQAFPSMFYGAGYPPPPTPEYAYPHPPPGGYPPPPQQYVDYWYPTSSSASYEYAQPPPQGYENYPNQ